MLNKLLLRHKIFMSIIALMTISFLTILLIAFLLGPPPMKTDKNTSIYSYDGHLIGYERGMENRQWVPLNRVNDHFIEAMIIAEDKHFYKHKGFDIKRTIYALWKNIRSWSLKEGASTITQQYARNLFLSHEKTWLRKIKEAFYTIRLEMFYTKDDILEGYINTIYFGHGAYGVETASNYYFNKPAEELTLAEATLLASIPRGPKYYSPFNDIRRAKARQQHILNLLKEEQLISEPTLSLAKREHLIFTQKQRPTQVRIGAYFHDVVRQEASELLQIDEETIRAKGYQIYTTLSVKQQAQLERTIEQTIDQASDIQVGAVALDQKTGAIRALVGGRDYAKSPYNRVTMAKRMPGSAIKPLLYYIALEHHYTPSTRLVSQPTTFKLTEEEVYAPKNYNGHYANGPITLAQALALSDNIYAVKTHLYLGVEQLAKEKERFGIESDLPAIPSLALGTASVTVHEMTTAFARLASGGLEIEPYTIEKIVDQQGKAVYERRQKSLRQVLDPKKAYIMTYLLTGMFNPTFNDYMQVTGSSMIEQATQRYAGKSGTTTYDRWMIGYSPILTTGVWVGYDDNRPIEKVAETNYAKTIWINFMEAIHHNQEKKSFPIPKGVVRAKIDPATGYLATPYCPKKTVMFYEQNSEPTSYCQVHFPEDTPREEVVESREKEQTLFEKIIELFSFKK